MNNENNHHETSQLQEYERIIYAAVTAVLMKKREKLGEQEFARFFSTLKQACPIPELESTIFDTLTISNVPDMQPPPSPKKKPSASIIESSRYSFFLISYMSRMFKKPSESDQPGAQLKPKKPKHDPKKGPH